MQNMTVGIIGTGRIGKAVIKNLSGFGCKIIAYDPYPAKDLENVEYVTLDELYARADIISLHTFLSDETYHMINKDSIAKMKDGVIPVSYTHLDVYKRQGHEWHQRRPRYLLLRRHGHG